MRRSAISSWIAGVGLLLSAVVAVVPAQAATTITLKAKGTIAVCNDDLGGTLAALSGGTCTGQVTLTQAIEVGPQSSPDTMSNPSLSLFGDGMTATIEFLGGGSLSYTSAFPDTQGFLTLGTLATSTAELTSAFTQLLAGGTGVATQMSVVSTTTPYITSANPLVPITYTLLPTDATFGVVFYDSLDVFSERWSFTAGLIESIEITVQRDGTVPEPTGLALLLLAMTALALMRVDRARHSRSR